jgi:hypothetical protein
MGAEAQPDGIPGLREERRSRRTNWLGTGSLSCPKCDAPAPLLARRAAPTTPLGCPFCDHSGKVSDFLSLAEPHRAPRVNVFVRLAP